VFYRACSFDCLFCQNWHFRDSRVHPHLSATSLAERAGPQTYCICFFGGDPTPQMPHALATAELLADRVRICWETNGSMHPKLLRRAMELSLRSGGCVKFDLKAFDERLHYALTGSSNRQTLANFAAAAEMAQRRPKPPALVASTLLVPGYVEVEEVRRIAEFVATLDPSIPYSLLAFYPTFCLTDLPRTSQRHGEECAAVASAAGLANVRLGNTHLLGRDY
jgi:pyruvate formate lyase activating enzyme